MAEIIQAYHAHVYYDPASTRPAAASVREGIAQHFPTAILGRWHDIPVGPHPQAMYQVAFPVDLFATLVPWLMLNREGLDVLIHPETGRERADHSNHAAWLGTKLELDLSKLPT